MNCCVFQFQTGAIKSANEGILVEEEGLFQFQTGAIKRDNLLMISPHFSRFNSKLVRLKGGDGGHLRPQGNAVSIPNWCD